MGMFAFRRLRERLEAASQEAASFAVQQSPSDEEVKPRRRGRQPKAIQVPEN
jgi:hypothetical protein